VDVAPIRASIGKLQSAAGTYEQALARISSARGSALLSHASDLGAVNKLLYTSERRFALERGLPRRDWFRHAIYAPGFYTGYGVKTLPALREGIEEGQWDEARAAVPAIAAAIDAFASQVNEAATALRKLSAAPVSQ
jgi:N-acetylated-alpha-linked acidic dipeptidase